MAIKKKGPPRERIGRVSLYDHHGQPWLYYTEGGQSVRRPAGVSGPAAQAIASLINARLAAAAAQVDVFKLIGDWLPRAAPAERSGARLSSLRAGFLDHHENVLASARGTVARYGTATAHVVDHAGADADPLDIDVAAFVTYLRRLEVSPNGHANTAKRKLRDKGLQYILQTCRSMVRFGQQHGLLDKSAVNPFSVYPIGRIVVRDRKPVFVFTAAQEEAFFCNIAGHAFAIQMVLAKTAMRPAELTHSLIEDVDLDGGWWHVRSKPELGWTTKTNRERAIPLVDEVAGLVRAVIGARKAGLVFLRQQECDLNGRDRAALGDVGGKRLSELSTDERAHRSRVEAVYHGVWQEAGIVNTDKIRLSFIKTAKAAGLPAHATCPKSWRHTFATVLQQANVDLLIRQETLGHKPSDPSAGALGMTGVYTHTDPQTQYGQVTAAMRLRPATLALGKSHFLTSIEKVPS